MKNAEITMKRVALADVLPHEKNPRIHPDPGTPAWETLKASLIHDYFDPLVLNETNNKWVSGHLRAKVLLAEGYIHADVVVKSYDEPTHYARMIAANKQIGDFDMPALKDLLLNLDELNMDMDLTGFQLPEIEDLMTQFHVEEEETTAAQESNDYHLQFKTTKEQAEIITRELHSLREEAGDESLKNQWRENRLVQMAENSGRYRDQNTASN